MIFFFQRVCSWLLWKLLLILVRIQNGRMCFFSSLFFPKFIPKCFPFIQFQVRKCFGVFFSNDKSHQTSQKSLVWCQLQEPTDMWCNHQLDAVDSPKLQTSFSFKKKAGSSPCVRSLFFCPGAEELVGLKWRNMTTWIYVWICWLLGIGRMSFQEISWIFTHGLFLRVENWWRFQ